MSRRPALFTQADLARVFAAAKRMGMAVRVDLVRGVVRPAHHRRGSPKKRNGTLLDYMPTQVQ